MSASVEIERIVRGLPKVSLHCHLIGSVQATTLVELAAKHGVVLDGGRTAENLFDHASYEDLDEFLRVLDVAGSVIRDVDDFHRVTYESLTAGGAAHNVLYREIFLSPPGHPGVAYRTIIDGVRAGMRDAETDTGIRSNLIVGLNRNDTPGAATELVETMIANPYDEVIGIGLDYSEMIGPPEKFWKAFRLAGEAGLQRTAHSESGPPHNIETILDLLGCSRVDHGYHIVDDPDITRRCVEERIPFTCTPVSSDIGRYSGSGDGSHLRIKQMVDAGLLVTIDSDDPPMFGTDPTHDYRALAHALGYGLDTLASFTDNAIEASWLDADSKRELQQRADRMVADLAAPPVKTP
ncbi:adenosine deaminase [Microbacterium sp. SORGH_AS_0862]|uniref:adenosine deaminase n=1 Tax=Microbacterium sp. SORGH_AS_0862 TaxID=3041789 RepID=UPI002791553E|nr:adenosine deaminase [Microbacterium sp. SORGH_AS_0862]MDQ1205322.1 adenosine deaminase [Microbacterium sp. SORGH_AS_0862]